MRNCKKILLLSQLKGGLLAQSIGSHHFLTFFRFVGDAAALLYKAIILIACTG